MIYFDHNATTAVDERVVEAMLPYITQLYGNPSGLYRLGRLARSAIDTARESVAALVNVSPAQVIFTSGGTEANNLAMQSSAGCFRVISAIEHPSIVEPVSDFSSLATIAVNSHGVIDSGILETVIRNQQDMTCFASLMLANNETGAIQNINKIAESLRGESVFLHTDAVQAVGKTVVDFNALGVDMMSLSSHKIYGPKGCGALIVKKQCDMRPLIVGGGQERGWRAGTENVAAIVGFGKAAELARIELTQRTAHCLQLRKKLEYELNTISGLVIFSEQVERLPNTIQFAIAGFDGEMLLMQLDMKNIAVSSGSACASGGRNASSVLLAMGVDDELAKGAIRVSLGKDNTEKEIEQFVVVLKTIVNER